MEQVLLANHACPSCGALGNTTVDLHLSGISLMGSGSPREVAAGGAVRATLGRVNSSSANPQGAWVAMGSPGGWATMQTQ